MALHADALLTVAELGRFMSPDAVDDFADHDGDNSADTDVVEDAINAASFRIYDLVSRRYSRAAIQAAGPTVTEWAMIGAAYHLSLRRMNPPSASLSAEYERLFAIGGWIDLVGRGVYSLDGVALRAELRPIMTNYTVDHRHHRNKIRSLPTSSSDASTTQKQSIIDEITHHRE